MSACYYLPLWLYDAVECRNCSASYNFSYDPRTKFPFLCKSYNGVKLNWVNAVHPESELWKHTATTNYPQSHSNLQSNTRKQNTRRHSASDCATTLSTAPNIQACPSNKQCVVDVSHQYRIRLTTVVVVVPTTTWWVRCLTFSHRTLHTKDVPQFKQKRKRENINVKYLELAALKILFWNITCSVLSALGPPVPLSETWKQDFLDQRSENQFNIQQNSLNFFCCAPYLHGSDDEGDLCPWVQVLVDDEPTGPLTGPHYATALDQHQQLGRVGQGIWAQVDKTGRFILCSIHLNVQENTGYHVSRRILLLEPNPQNLLYKEKCILSCWICFEYDFIDFWDI